MWMSLPFVAVVALTQDFQPKGSLKFTGRVEGDQDLSAVESVVEFGGRWLIVASDETAELQLLRPGGEGAWEVCGELQLDKAGVEIDLEALAVDGTRGFALGSHSLVRKKLRRSKDVDKNRERLLRVEHEEERDALFEFRLGPDGFVAEARRFSLRKTLRNDPVLGRFAEIPGKENGIDFEGLALFEGRLFLGLRGPVLRGNLAVVMVLDPDKLEDYELRYLNLGGWGIRALDATRQGLIGIAGPVGGVEQDCVLFEWSGQSEIPGRDARRATAQRLAVIPSPVGARAEGLCVMAEDEQALQLLVVFDGAKNGAPQCFEWRKTLR